MKKNLTINIAELKTIRLKQNVGVQEIPVENAVDVSRGLTPEIADHFYALCLAIVELTKKEIDIEFVIPID